MADGEAAGRPVEQIEEEIAELKRRWPAHSVSPALWDQLESLETELEAALRPTREDGNAG